MQNCGGLVAGHWPGLSAERKAEKYSKGITYRDCIVENILWTLGDLVVQSKQINKQEQL